MNTKELAIIISVMIVLFAFIFGAHAQTNWENNQYNYANSQYNYNNSQYNYANSPYNYNNSQYNYNSNNGVYENGKRVGYEVTAPNGTTNIFDNYGNRIGYTHERH